MAAGLHNGLSEFHPGGTMNILISQYPSTCFILMMKEQKPHFGHQQKIRRSLSTTGRPTSSEHCFNSKTDQISRELYYFDIYKKINPNTVQ